MRLLIDAAHRVGAILDLMHRETLEQGARIEIARGLGLADHLVIVIAVPDRLLEDRRVGGDPLEPVLLDHLGELAALQKIAADKVEPGRLSEIVQLLQGVWHGLYSFRASCALAAA